MLLGIIAIAVAIGVIIFGHEVGHWLPARIFGMRTKTFSIGFGPRKYALKLFRFWETDFVLSLIPLGGYVKLTDIEGDNDNNDAPAREFPIWQRAIVMCGGVVMNFIMAVVMVFALFMMPDSSPVTISRLSQQVTVAKDAGLRSGDVIVAIAGRAVESKQSVLTAVHAHAGQPIAMVINRNGAQQTVHLVPNAAGLIGVEVTGRDFTHVPVLTAAVMSMKICSGEVGDMFYAIGGMLHLVPPTPGVNASDVHSVVGIAAYGAKVFSVDFRTFMNLLVILALNLAVVNILPIPVLDGGAIGFLFLEPLLGKPSVKKIQSAANAVFIVVLVAFMFFALHNDILHPMK